MIKFLHSDKFLAGLPKVLIITLIWVFICIFESGFDYLNFYQYNIFPADYNFWIRLESNILAVTVAGLFGGSFFIYGLNDYLRNHCYGKVLWTIFGVYNIIFFIALVVGSFFHKCSINELMAFDTKVLLGVWEYISTFSFLRDYFFWGIVSLLTIIALQVNDKYGSGVFWAFIRGKYFHPRKEERIFMFLDLRGSTTIAEQIGEELYFDFLRDFFKDITPSILINKGEIYQYVGDEVIISWERERGLKNERALECFFAIQQAMKEKELIYKEKYGVIPSFKAGLHLGQAMIGEIGVIKKDIAFSGDVLNTTARIQARCNEFGVDLLVSGELVEALNLSTAAYHTKELGRVNLRGRTQSIELFTLRKTFMREILPPNKEWSFA